ncbi:hypothetical protein ACFLSW_00825 [Candidatus Bipolaricaulota bacterium]
MSKRGKPYLDDRGNPLPLHELQRQMKSLEYAVEHGETLAAQRRAQHRLRKIKARLSALADRDTLDAPKT